MVISSLCKKIRKSETSLFVDFSHCFQQKMLRQKVQKRRILDLRISLHKLETSKMPSYVFQIFPTSSLGTLIF